MPRNGGYTKMSIFLTVGLFVQSWFVTCSLGSKQAANLKPVPASPVVQSVDTVALAHP